MLIELITCAFLVSLGTSGTWIHLYLKILYVPCFLKSDLSKAARSSVR